MKQQLLTLRIVWLALMGATGLFLFLSYSLSQSAQVPENTQASNIVWGFAFVVAIAGKFLPPVIAKKAVNKQGALMIGYIVRYALFDAVGVAFFMNIAVFGVPFKTGAWGFVAVLALFLLNPPRETLE